jgi:GTPase SAR1 family protein
MARDRDDLLRGQGLLRQGITGARSRWKHYFKLLAGATLIGTFGWPIYTAGFASIETAYHFEQARMGAWIGKGTGTEPSMTVFKDGKAYAVRDSEIANDPRYQWLVDQLVHDAMFGGIIGLLIGAAGCGGLAWMMRERGRAAGKDRVICGSVIVDEKALRKMTRRQSDARSLHIATVSLPTNLECRHFALLGTTGAGKTTVLRQMLDGIEARGEPALVYDTSGEFIAHYYRPERGDVILNPFDARSAYWSPFAEIAHPADADRIAHQLVTSTGKEEDDVWLETARILVANILRVLGREGLDFGLLKQGFVQRRSPRRSRGKVLRTKISVSQIDFCKQGRKQISRDHFAGRSKMAICASEKFHQTVVTICPIEHRASAV